MKTMLVFLALLLGTVLNVYSGEIGGSVNGWSRLKVEGNNLDTAYIFSTNDGAIEGNTSMAIVYSVDGPPTKAFWGKKFDKKYRTPNFMLTMKVKLVELYRDSNFYPALEIFAGKSENPSKLYKMGQITIDRRSLGEVTYMFPQFDTLAIKELDSLDFVAISAKNWLNQNGGAKFIVDDMTLFYGKPGGDYRFEIIDRFGDPDPVTTKPELSCSPKFADFGILKINEVPHKDTLVIFRNTGNDTIKGVISVIGKGYSVSNKNLLIAPMDSVTRTVRFAPSEIGKDSGFLVITSNSPTSPDTVFLTGFGDKSTGISDNPEAPKEFSLSQNYPNPFNPSTSIEYQVSSRQYVNLTIYDMLGREIAILVDEIKSAGRYEAKFNASKIPSGTYFYRLTANNFTATKKMILIK